jgi:hypothetical protein
MAVHMSLLCAELHSSRYILFTELQRHLCKKNLLVILVCQILQ